MFERKIAELFLSQRYHYVNRATDYFGLEFFQGPFYRRIKVNGAPFIRTSKLYQCNEIWGTICKPWKDFHINNEQLVYILDNIGEFKSTRPVTDNNVIKVPSSFWSKSTENRNGS